ncbi:MAG: hypothetical protein V8T87_12460 [Victivallales bacterium]
MTGSNDFAMMREAVSRHFYRLLEEKQPLPDLLIVDGGKGQLSSAVDALLKLNCPPFPVIGLAKRNEEVFIPGRSEPVVIDKERPSLKLLQAIRDESHRFAVTYHRALRLRTIQNSLLDEIPIYRRLPQTCDSGGVRFRASPAQGVAGDDFRQSRRDRSRNGTGDS